MKQRLIRNAVIKALSIGWGLIVSLLLTPFLIRSLGNEAYGIWILATSFSAASGYLSLLDFGVQTSIVKFVAEHHARLEFKALNEVVSAAFLLFTGLGGIGAAGLSAFAGLFLIRVFHIPAHLADAARLLLWLLAAQTLFEFPGFIFSAVLEGLQRYDLLSFIEMGRLAIYALLVFVLLSWGYGVIALGLVTLLIAIARAAVMGLACRRLLPSLHFVWRQRRETYRQILRFSGKIFALRINAVIYNQMDKIIIGALLTSTLLTDYDIANKVNKLVLTSLTLINPLMIPAASQLKAQEDDIRLQELFLKGTKYTIALCLPLAIFAIVLAEPIIRCWIGPAYVHDAGITRLYLLYLLYTAATAVGYNMMIGMGQIGPLLGIQSAITAINLIASVVLVNFVGLSGVIWGTLIGNALGWYPYMRHFLSTLDITWERFWREVVWRTYPLAALFAAFLYAVSWLYVPHNLMEIAAMGGAGLAIYAGLFYWLSLDNAERVAFRAAIMRT